MLLLVSSRIAIWTSGFGAAAFSPAALSCICMLAARRVRMMSLVFMNLVFLFGDFINGVVEREQDVLAERHPRRGLGMLFEKIEVGFGIKLNTLPLRHILRGRINPLLAILKKGTAVHDF